MIPGRIIVIGESSFSKSVIDRLVELKCDIIAVLARESNDEDHDDLRSTAKLYNISWHQVVNVNSPSIVELISRIKPDVIYCVGFRRIIGGNILQVCPVVGFHPSPLPIGRGHSPLWWALDLGWIETSATWFVMDEGCDTGDILDQKAVPILTGDTYTSLLRRTTEIALSMIPDLDLSRRMPQDNAKATLFRKRSKETDKWIPY